ncbi:Ectonucleoside triphosphate diphosphohydrolase 5 [Binucleata daphniae]
MKNDIKNHTTKYVGVIDAGTTGTRFNIYGFIMPGRIISYYNILKVKPGLHTLNTKDEIKKSLNQMLKKVEKKMKNKIDIKQVPITFSGTAGIRSLTDEKRNMLLEVVNNCLSAYNNQNNETNVISAFTEGLYALETLKFLKEYNDSVLYRYGCAVDSIHEILSAISKSFCEVQKKDNAQKYIGVIEIGGGSIQIAYEFDKKDKYNDPLHVIENSNKKIYINAFPGWGLVEGLHTLDINKDYAIKDDNKKITMIDELIKDFKAENKPNINNTDEIYLLAFFYDKYTELGCNFETTLEEIKKKTKKKCSGIDSTFCKEINYMNMFMDAQGFDADKKLYLIKDIAGVNASWTVRQALTML